MKKLFPIITVSLLFVASMFILYSSQRDRLFDTSKNRICLNEDLDTLQFAEVLVKNAYVSTEKDARVISEYLYSQLKGGKKLSNLGSLNSRDFQIPARIIENEGGDGLKKRLSLSYADLGCENISMKDSVNMITSDSTCTIRVNVRDDGKHFFNEGVVDSVEVCLIRHLKYVDPESNRAEDKPSIVSKGITNHEGTVTFNVDPKGFYSVLPVKKGFEFGVPKGTTNGVPIGEEKVRDFTFIQKEHRLRMFDRSTYARIKADGVLCVHSAGDYVSELVKITVAFLLVWWLTVIYVRWKDGVMVQHNSSRYRYSDIGLISILMLLNAICLFSMLAITNPLVDTDYGHEMIWGTVIGCFGLCLFSSFDYVKYYSNLYVIKYDMVSTWMKKSLSEKVPEGIGFIFIALFFVILLGLFGSGPEGSDAKVNLFFFQPSEISKFFVVSAIAIFFTANAKKIQAFANGHFFVAQAKALLWIIISIVILLALYVFIISDMGPALVLAITFIILYSILRQDFLQMSAGVFTYLVILSFVSHIPVEDKASIVFWLTILWLFVWVVGGYLWKKRIYESAVFMNILILLFTRGGELLKMMGRPHEGERLMRRIAASGDGIWDNTVRGGDQVAQGVWALASGGFTGQGLGNGNANLIPAFQTDMIFESIGEVMGFIALFAVLICYAMLIWKCLKRSNESGHPFLLYMIAGIGIVTTVQLFVIIMGSLGIIPLTGISLPFLSYGKAGLVVNLSVFGIVVGMSRHNPTKEERKLVIGYRSVVKSGRTVFLLLFIIVLAYAFNYQVFSRDTYLTKPAKITNLAGARILEQNPRINILLRNLDAGNIFDRYGRILATSNTDTLNNKKYRNLLIDAGVNGAVIDSLSHTIKRRYYPFEEQLFFMLGDMNTRNLSDGVLSDDPYGYLAEERHIDFLRGFSIPTEEASMTLAEVVSPYLPSDTICKNIRIPLYEKCDTIIKLLKDGVNGNLVKQMNKESHSRNITLTIDAVLQTQLQKAMSNNSQLFLRPNSRVSLVILDVKNGDLLCSANYPTPNQDSIVSFFNKRNYVFRPSITERDLGLTFQTPPGSTAKVFSAAAGLEKNGTDATKAIYIYKDELIHADNGEEPSGNVTMREAIVKSSNCFFVNLVHRDRLYNNLAPLYMNTGVKVDRNVPYVFNSDEMTDTIKNTYLNRLVAISDDGYRVYDDYIKRRTSENYYRKMNFTQCNMAWGQGAMEASPLNMARMVSIVANGGVNVSTRYLKDSVIKTSKLMEKNNADLLAEYMRAEAKNHAEHWNPQKRTLLYSKSERLEFGGKTGTPEFAKNKKDGWYICFFNSNKGKLAMALRIERCSGSGVALQWMDKVIMPTLKEVGYVNY